MGAGTEQSRIPATDATLVLDSLAGDISAFEELFRRHSHPAWRLAVAVSGSRAGATDAVVEGFTRALQQARRAGAPPGSFRVAVVRATRQAAVHRAPAAGTEPVVAAPNDVAAAYRELPERWRSALWLTAVEGGTPAQVADVLALDPDAVTSLAERARAGLHERYLDHQRHAADPGCRAAIDDLDGDPHVDRCAACRDRRALLGDLHAALAPLVATMPAGLLTSANTRFDRWREDDVQRERRRLAWVGPVAPWAEKALAGAAAAVVGVGLLGATLFAGRGDRVPELAAPTIGGGGASSTETGGGLPEPSEIVVVAPPPSSGTSTGGGRTGAGGDGTSSGVVLAGAPLVASTPTPAAGPATVTPAPTAPVPPPPAPAPTAPASVGVDAAVDVAGTPVVVSIGSDNVGVQVGDLVIGDPAPADSGIVVDTGGLLPPIDLTPITNIIGRLL